MPNGKTSVPVHAKKMVIITQTPILGFFFISHKLEKSVILFNTTDSECEFHLFIITANHFSVKQATIYRLLIYQQFKVRSRIHIYCIQKILRFYLSKI